MEEWRTNRPRHKCEKISSVGQARNLMSQSRLTREPKPPRPIVWWHIAVGLATLLIGVGAAFLAANWINSYPSAYETAKGRIIEVRRVVDHTRDTLYGGKISYRAEAHVLYLANSQMQNRWVRVSDDLSQETLLLKLASHPTECVVYWPPNHQEKAKCSLK